MFNTTGLVILSRLGAFCTCKSMFRFLNKQDFYEENYWPGYITSYSVNILEVSLNYK